MSILYLRNPVFIKPCFAVNCTLVLFMMNYSQFCAEPYFVSLCPTTPILEAVSSENTETMSTFFGFLPPCGLLLSIFGSSISSERNNFVRWILSYLLWMLRTSCPHHCALALCAFSRDETISLRYCFSSFNLFISALLSGYLASYISFLHISSDSARRYTNLGGSIFCERIRCILQCGHDVRNIVPSVNVDDTMSLTLCLLWTLRKRFPQRYNQVLCAFQWLFYSCFAFRIFGLVYLFPAL